MILGAVVLLLVACALVAAELFLPTHGILSVIAILVALASIIMAYHVSPLLGLFFGLAAVLMTPVVFYWAVQIYPRSPVGRRVMLDTPQPRASGQAMHLAQLVGGQGRAMTTLRPAGSIELQGQRIDALSESGVIDSGTPIEVIRVVGQKVIVKPLA